MSDNSNNNKSQTYYEILGLTSDASLLDIKTAYRTLALKYHPDNQKKKPTDDDEDYNFSQRFRQVGEAYRCLSDRKERKIYDRELKPYGEYRSLSESRPLQTATTTTRRVPNSFVGMPYQHPYQLRSPPQKQKEPPPPKLPSPSSYFNPYQQFDDLFRSDPFFHEEILLEADGAFAQRFNQGSSMTVSNVYNQILKEDGDDDEMVGGGDHYESSSLSSTISSSNISSLSSLESDKLKRNGMIVIEQQLGATATASSTAGNDASKKDDEGFWFTKLLHQCGIHWDTTSATSTIVPNDDSGQEVAVVVETAANDYPVVKETTKITQSLTSPSPLQPRIRNAATNPPVTAESSATTTDTHPSPATTTTTTTATTTTTNPPALAVTTATTTTTATNNVDATTDKESYPTN